VAPGILGMDHLGRGILVSVSATMFLPKDL
jgi:hypothetical protein